MQKKEKSLLNDTIEKGFSRYDFEEYQNADPENCEIHIYIGIK